MRRFLAAGPVQPSTLLTPNGPSPHNRGVGRARAIVATGRSACRNSRSNTQDRRSGMARLETTGRRRANGRSRRSPLIDRRHAKVWISMSQPPLTQPRSRPREQFGPSCDTSSMSAFVIWAATPWEGRGAATAKPRIISAYSSTCSDMASASSTSMPR